MTSLYGLLEQIEQNKERNLQWFLDFAKDYLDFTRFGDNNTPRIQADIISQNESQYHFIQYKDDGKHCVTRPINSQIFITSNDIDEAERKFKQAVKNIRDIQNEPELRQLPTP